jgi:hypothetical protein
MKKQLTWLMAAMMAMLIIGCANQKGPAEQALSGAESGLNAIRDTAQKYVPDQLAAVDAQLASLKDAFAKGDYKAVMAGAPALTAAIGSLKDAAAAKASEAEAVMAKAKDAWGSTSAEVNNMVAALQSRVDMLSKSHHLPSGVTKASLASAKSGLDSMKSAWNDATTAAGSGDFTTAMAKAATVKDQATALMQSLGMTSG